MKTRIAIPLLFLLGVLLTLGGAAVAVAGPSSDGSVRAAQYGDDDDDDDDDGEESQISVLAATQAGPPGPGAPQQGVLGEEESGGPGEGAAPGRAGELPAGRLPFTGWSAIVVIVVGLALLTAGMLLRRRLNAGGKPA